MTQVTYFPRYSQKENHVTNNTLLLLRHLYEFNRLKFAKFLEELGDDAIDIAERLGLQFKQQQPTISSVADGFVTQESIKVVIESKLDGNAFNRDQLLRHLSAFDQSRGPEGQLLVLLSPNDPDDAPTAGFKVPVLRTTFQQILTAARNCLSEHEEEMIAIIDDFEQFCSDEKLLPRDRFTMFTPPCGRSFESNLKHRLYYCPAERHVRKATFLGIYKKKSVRAIGRIEKVVTCRRIDLDRGKVEIENDLPVTDKEKQRILCATREWDSELDNHKFYLCNEMVETDYKKKSGGGMLKHRYFDLGHILDVQDLPGINEISQRLRCKAWC